MGSSPAWAETTTHMIDAARGLRSAPLCEHCRSGRLEPDPVPQARGHAQALILRMAITQIIGTRLRQTGLSEQSRMPHDARASGASIAANKASTSTPQRWEEPTAVQIHVVLMDVAPEI